MDIGDFLDIRTVKATISKSAQGMMVPVEMIAYENGEPGVAVKSGETIYRVPVNILAADENNAVIVAKNETDTLISGQRIVKQAVKE